MPLVQLDVVNPSDPLKLGAQLLGQVGHLVKTAGAAPVQPRSDLVRTKSLLAELFGHPSLKLGVRQPAKFLPLRCAHSFSAGTGALGSPACMRASCLA